MYIDKIHTKAFSVIELLVAVVLVTIALFVVIPSFRGIISKNRAMVYADGVKVALQFARSAAINLGEEVYFCGSKNHKTCDGSWQDGQIVVTKSGKVLRVLPSVFAGDKLNWRGSDGVKEKIRFFPDKLLNSQQGSFYYCPQGLSENALAIVLSPTGRVNIVEKTSQRESIPCNF